MSMTGSRKRLPAAVERRQLSNLRLDDAQSSLDGGIQVDANDSPSLLNETAFNYADNTVKITPVGVAAQPSGWSATTFFPLEDNVGSRLPEIDLGSPYGTNWTSSYFPWKNFYAAYQIRDDVSFTRGRHQFKFGAGYLRVVKNQQLQANTQGTAVFNSGTIPEIPTSISCWETLRLYPAPVSGGQTLGQQ